MCGWRGHNTVIYDADPLAKPWSLSSRKAGSVQQARGHQIRPWWPSSTTHSGSCKSGQNLPPFLLLFTGAAATTAAGSQAWPAPSAVIQPQLSCLILYLFLPLAMCFAFIWLSALMELLLSRHLATTRKTTHFSVKHTLTHMQHALLIKKSMTVPGRHNITLHGISRQARILGFLEGEISSLVPVSYLQIESWHAPLALNFLKLVALFKSTLYLNFRIWKAKIKWRTGKGKVLQFYLFLRSALWSKCLFRKIEG